MNKKLFVFFIIVFFTAVIYPEVNSGIIEKIEKYSGKNSKKIISYYNSSEKEKKKYLKFLLSNMSKDDLAVITPEYLDENIKIAVKGKSFEYSSYNDKIFKHFVLPYRVSQEPLQKWRKLFYNELKDRVKKFKDIKKAITVANLWAFEQMTFKPTSSRDQGPITTMKRGFGRCEEMMIIMIDALRSVGIPARPVYTPLWNFTDNNHAWVEVWTPEGWFYIGEPAPVLNKTWFTNSATRASFVLSHALGNYKSNNSIIFRKNETLINSIEYYTDYDNYKIVVKDENNNKIKGAVVTIYGLSYGGFMRMLKMKTDKNGVVNFPMGKTSIFITAYYDKKLGHGYYNSFKMDKNKIVLKLKEKSTINKKYVFNYPVEKKKNREVDFKPLIKNYNQKKELSKLRRKNKHYENRKGLKFLDFYDEFHRKDKNFMNDEYLEKRENFIDKCNDISGNIEIYIDLLKNAEKEERQLMIKLIENWDVKSLIEISDKKNLKNIIEVFLESKKYYEDKIDKNLFLKNVLGKTWESWGIIENGWEKELKNKIVKFRTGDIPSTVDKVLKWVENNIKIDEDKYRSYFSGELNPVEILNKKFVYQFQKNRLIAASLRVLGIPVKWSGFLKYYNGEKFINIGKKNNNQKTEEKTVYIKIDVDGKQIEAKPMKNFMILGLNNSGYFKYIFINGKNNDKEYRARFEKNLKDKICISSVIRNSNGDASFIIKEYEKGKQNYEFYHETPEEYFNQKKMLDVKTEKKIHTIIKNKINNKKNTMTIILGKKLEEPQKRLLENLDKRSEKLQKKVNLLIISETNKNRIEQYFKSRFYYKKSDDYKFNFRDYPVILIYKNEKVIFSSDKFNLNILDYIERNLLK